MDEEIRVDADAAVAPDDTARAGEALPQRLCPNCSAISTTDGEFCPHCGASFLKRPRYVSRRLAVVISVAFLLVALAVGGTTFAIKRDRDQQHDRAVAAQNARAAAAAAETKQQIAERHAAEREMQTSITNWARKQGSVLDGPILRTSCTPIGGGSENLSEVTVRYDCLAINKDNADGSSSGYRVHATMDFSTGEYQWGLGGG